jgi:hypothetical protein
MSAATPESFESLWAYCCENNRLIPRDWNALYKRLANTHQKPSGGWVPGLPLILAGWHTTMPIDKHLRFREHVEWARDQAQLEEIGVYLRALPEGEWFHFGEI